MRISATQWKSGDWRGAATEPLGDVLHSEGEVLRSSGARWLGIEMSRLDAPGKATAEWGLDVRGKGMAQQRAVQRSLVEWREATVLQGYVMRGKGLALQRIVLQRNGSGKPCLERYRNEE